MGMRIIIKLSKGIVINFVIFGTLSNVVNLINIKTKVCEGFDQPTAMENVHTEVAYKASVSKYANCTHIVNHLSLFYLKATDDISFLSSIVEVGGSVVIGKNTVREIPLSNLRVIHGRECWSFERYSYSISFFSNQAPSGKPAYLNLRSLVKIKRCGVYLFENGGFCNLHAIAAVIKRLFDRDDQNFKYTPSSVKCPEKETCSPSCDTDNGKSICHGPRTDMCRHVPKYVKECPSECLGGCFEPINTKCLACRSYSNGEECVEHCPASKSIHFTACVDATCQKRYLSSKGECVANCPTETYPKDGRCDRCEECTASMCDGVCRIKASTTMRHTLKVLKHCTVVDGDISINLASSSTDQYGDEAVRAEDLKNLKNVRHINGNLQLNLREYPTIKSLSFLSNLESVNAPKEGKGIQIVFSKGLEYLGLKKLRAVNASQILLMSNSKLCYLENICSRFGNSVDAYSIIMNNRNCGSKRCDPACGENGCWGPGREMCVQTKPRFRGKCSVELFQS